MFLSLTINTGYAIIITQHNAVSFKGETKMKRDFEIAQENFYKQVAKLDWKNDPNVLEKAEKLSKELNPFHSLCNFAD